MKSRVYTVLMSIAIATLCLLPVAGATPPVEGSEAELFYDDNSGEGYFSQVNQGDMESLSFFVEHPATLVSLRFMFSSSGGGGPAVLKLWKDGGGHSPDMAIEAIAPKSVTVEPGAWFQWDLSGEDIELDPLQPIHVGIEVVNGGPTLAVDNSSTDQQHSLLYIKDEDAWYGVSDGNFMVRATLRYHDVVTDPAFVDVTDHIGAKSAARPAWGDFDNDGWPDLLINGHTLLRNTGNGTFTDVTETAGIGGRSVGGGLWADVNNDGWLDIFVAGGEGDGLWINNGDGSFTETPRQSGAPGDSYPSEGAAFADYDNDGWVDLYIANYEKPDQMSAGTPDFFWHNRGDGTLADFTGKLANLGTDQCGRGVVWCDFDNDGDSDLFVANYRLDPDFFFINDLGSGYLYNDAKGYGVEGEPVSSGSYGFNYGHSIGASFGDYDNDGDFDLVVGNLAHPRFIEFSDKTMLYQNSGDTGDPQTSYRFTDVRQPAGIAYAETHSEASFADIDNDGWQDLFLTSIYVGRQSFFYRNKGDGSFEDAGYQTGLWVENGWGAGFCDFDRDGDLDVATRRFMRNDGSSATENHWLQVRAFGGLNTNRAAIGVRIIVDAGNGLRMMQEVGGGKGTTSQDDLTRHFGLGAAPVLPLTVTVRWTDNSTWSFEVQDIDRLIVVAEDLDAPGAYGTDFDRYGPDGRIGDDVDGDEDIPAETETDPEADGPDITPTDNDDSGCATGVASLWFLIAALLLLRRRRV